MLDNITALLNAILDAIKYWMDSGLADSTAITIGKIMNYSIALLIPLIWEYYYAYNKG